jgi:multiple sugar transport system substrate-binding protein
VLGATTLPWLAAGCGESAAPAQSQRPVTVSYLNNLAPTNVETQSRLAVLEEFNATNTQKITVDLTEAKAAAANFEKLKTLAAAGSGPDLYWARYFDGPDFYLSGITLDVDAELKKDREWAKQRADVFPAMLESALWAGKLVSFPAYANNQAMIYNTGLLQQAGVAAPRQGWTWDDFRTSAQRVTREGILPLSMGWVNTWLHWLGTTGTRVVSKDVRKMQVDTPEMLQVMELWLDLLNRGVIRLDADGKSGLMEQYAQARNDVVFEVQGPYRIPPLRQAKAPDFGTVHVPVHPSKKEVFASNGGHSLVLCKSTPEKQAAAAQVAKWLTAPHAQAQVCVKSYSIPVSKGAQAAKELQDQVSSDPAFKGFVDLAPYGWRWPGLPSQQKIQGAIENAIGAIMRKEVGAKAGLITAQREAQALLDDDVRLMK